MTPPPRDYWDWVTGDPWLMLWVGVGVGLFVIPRLIEWITRGKEYERFYQEFRSESLGKTKSEFFIYLSRAYEHWKQDKQGLPDSIDDLLESTEYPDWLPVEKNKELLSAIEEKFRIAPPILWEFCHELYKQMDGYLKKRQDTDILPPDEIFKLHNARQRLSYFWQDAGILVFKEKQLRLWQIKRHLDSDRRFLTALTFLSLALHKANKQKGRGAEHLHYLLAVFFEKKKHGFAERWNPPVAVNKWKI